MKINCPNCGLDFPLIAGVNDAEARRVAQIMGDVPPKLAALVVSYLQLFKPAKSGLTWRRVRALLDELVTDIKAGRVRRKGRDWIAPAEHWALALQDMIDRRDKLALPLKSHGYLYEILVGLADRAETGAENRREDSRRQRSSAEGSMRSIGEMTQELQHLKKMVADTPNEKIKDALQGQADRLQTEIEKQQGGS